MVNFKKLLVASAVAASSFAASTAHALPWYSLTGWEDDNLEYHVDVNGDGLLSVGDRLVGVIEFTKVFNIAGSEFVTSPGIYGFFDTTVTSITNVDANPFFAERIQFGASAGFEATYGAGAMVAFFLDPSSSLSISPPNCASIAACEAAVTSMDSLMTLGLGDADDEWYSVNAALATGAVAVTPASTKVATVNYGLSILENNSGVVFNQQSLGLNCFIGFTCAGDGMVDLIGSGDVLGGQGLSNGYIARSDIDVQFAVPEPGTLALIGLSLVGLAATRRRSKV